MASPRIYCVIIIYNINFSVIRHNEKGFAKNKNVSVNIYLKNTKGMSISFEPAHNLLIYCT